MRTMKKRKKIYKRIKESSGIVCDQEHGNEFLICIHVQTVFRLDFSLVFI